MAGTRIVIGMNLVPDPHRRVRETDTTIIFHVDLIGNGMAEQWLHGHTTLQPLAITDQRCGWWCKLIHRPVERWHPADPLLRAAMEVARARRRRPPPAIVLEDEGAQMFSDARPVSPQVRQALDELVRIGRDFKPNLGRDFKPNHGTMICMRTRDEDDLARMFSWGKK